MSNILSCITGPRLYSGPDPSTNQIINYSANILETIPTFTLVFMKFIIGFFKWTALFWMPFIVKKYKTADGVFSVSRFLLYVSTGYAGLAVMRGVGRMINPMYSDFLTVLHRAQQAATFENMEQLSLYQFDFAHWPVQYDAANYRGRRMNKSVPKRQMNLPRIFKPICYMLAHTIGIRMAFPGCTGLINSLVASQRRDRLIYMMQHQNVKRIKIRTEDNNDIEAFYKDNRQSSHSNGNILVICCEGNAGYPELGNPKIAMELNYSVIGWNHPGFGGSTGLPFPKSEEAAIDAIMKYALEALSFDVENIVLFGWSIGGYTASWAAMNYPNIRSVVLDATFDNIDKLAEKSLPIFLYPLVLDTVHEYIDLNVGEHMIRYNGPVRFIIRSQDEIIASEPGDKTTNRGYFLMINLLKKRYPNLISNASIKSLWEYLSSNKHETKIFLSRNIDTDLVKHHLLNALKNNTLQQTSTTYPLMMTNLSEQDKSQILIYLASKYAVEFDGNHCAELPSKYLQLGWMEHDIEND